MFGFIENLEKQIGLELKHIFAFAHGIFQGKMGDHGHVGMAIIEAFAEVCRKHPTVVSLAVAGLVELLLAAEKKHHEEHMAAVADHHEKRQLRANRKATPKPLTRAAIRRQKSKRLKPLRLALEVLGGLTVLKIANSSTRFFHHKHHGEVWFAPLTKVGAFSAALATYNLISAINDPKVNALRNGAIFYFATVAFKPLLDWYAHHPLTLPNLPDLSTDHEAEAAPSADAVVWHTIEPQEDHEVQQAFHRDVDPIRFP